MVTIGVNRICRAFQPDFLLLVDTRILRDEEAAIRAFPGPIIAWSGLAGTWLDTLDRTSYFELRRGRGGHPSAFPSDPQDPLLREGTSTAYALQLAVLAGASRLGMLGIDFSAPTLRSRGEPTHFYGDGARLGSTGGGGWNPQREAAYRGLYHWAASRGCAGFNLSPFEDTPIHKAGWPKMSLEDFVEAPPIAQQAVTIPTAQAQPVRPAERSNAEPPALLATAAAVIRAEADAILALADRLDDSFSRCVEILRGCPGRVVVTGIGKSGHIGRKLAATLASTGTPALFLHAGEAGHGDLGMVTKQDVVLAISNSGETPELLHLLPAFEGLGVPIVSLTGRLDSTLARASAVALDVGVAYESSPHGLAPTSSAAAALVMGHAIAAALMEARQFTPVDFAARHPAGSLGRHLLQINDRKKPIDQVPRADQVKAPGGTGPVRLDTTLKEHRRTVKGQRPRFIAFRGSFGPVWAAGRQRRAHGLWRVKSCLEEMGVSVDIVHSRSQVARAVESGAYLGAIGWAAATSLPKHKGTRTWIEGRGMVMLFAENGWFPQRTTVYLDHEGIGQESSLYTREDVPEYPDGILADTRARIARYQESNALENYDGVRRAQPPQSDQDWILWPLQVQGDSALYLQASENRDQQVVLDRICDAFPGERFGVRPHPQRPSQHLRLPRNAFALPHSVPIGAHLAACKAVAGISSTVLVEALTYDKPVMAVGEVVGTRAGVFSRPEQGFLFDESMARRRLCWITMAMRAYQLDTRHARWEQLDEKAWWHSVAR